MYILYIVCGFYVLLPIYAPRYLFEVSGKDCTDLCNQWLEWETTDLQVRSIKALVLSNIV